MGKFILGADALSATRNYEVQRNNNFQVSFAGIEGAETLTLAVDSFALPTIANEPIELSHGNSKVKVAGGATFEGGDLVVKDFIIADTEKIVENWRKQVYNAETDAIGWAADYKKQGLVSEFSPDGTVERSWTLKGCWPSSVAYGEFSNDGADKKTITVTIAFDKAVRNM
jgi:hypothetical protein